MPGRTEAGFELTVFKLVHPDALRFGGNIQRSADFR
jgi:hypothetical protein